MLCNAYRLIKTCQATTWWTGASWADHLIVPGSYFDAQFAVSVEVGNGRRAAAAPSSFLRTKHHRYNFFLIVVVSYLLAL